MYIYVNKWLNKYMLIFIKKILDLSVYSVIDPILTPVPNLIVISATKRKYIFIS